MKGMSGIMKGGEGKDRVTTMLSEETFMNWKRKLPLQREKHSPISPIS